MRTLLLGLLFFASLPLSAQNNTIDTSTVNSIHGIVNEVLHIISGEQGKKRDWEQFRQLFLPTAQFAVLYHKDDGTKHIQTLASGRIHTDGWKGISKWWLLKVDAYNGIAQVFQSYYAKESDNEEKGINSFQWVHDGKRWWIFNILWTNDRNGVKVPDKYLKN